MIRQKPRFAVLLATYNGEKWLQKQLDSIFEQIEVSAQIIVSDDKSTDSTAEILRQNLPGNSLVLLPEFPEKFGCANRNFLRLVLDANIGDAAYVAFADQDDIWNSGKLIRAVKRLNETGASGYSSDVIAFWPDGRKRRIVKSYPQRSLDHIFGSPGPGCTFVFTRKLFLDLREWVSKNIDSLSKLWVHDWTFYAFARSKGYQWIIDNLPTMQYRQHESNEIGVNFGWGAIKRRFEIIRDGRYRKAIIALSEITQESPKCLRSLLRLSLIDRFWLICRVNQFRRRRLDMIALAFIFLVMRKD